MKPYLPFDRVPMLVPIHSNNDAIDELGKEESFLVPAWIQEADVPDREVVFDNRALEGLRELLSRGMLRWCNDEASAKLLVTEVCAVVAVKSICVSMIRALCRYCARIFVRCIKGEAGGALV